MPSLSLKLNCSLQGKKRVSQERHQKRQGGSGSSLAPVLGKAYVRFSKLFSAQIPHP